jgi:hypothetical protein
MGQQDAKKEDLAKGVEKTAYKVAGDKREAEIAKAFAPMEVACTNL